MELMDRAFLSGDNCDHRGIDEAPETLWDSKEAKLEDSAYRVWTDAPVLGEEVKEPLVARETANGVKRCSGAQESCKIRAVSHEASVRKATVFDDGFPGGRGGGVRGEFGGSRSIKRIRGQSMNTSIDLVLLARQRGAYELLRHRIRSWGGGGRGEYLYP